MFPVKVPHYQVLHGFHTALPLPIPSSLTMNPQISIPNVILS